MNTEARDLKPAVNTSDKLNNKINLYGNKPPPQQYQQRFSNSSIQSFLQLLLQQNDN